jgi:prepilin-type N-terminal cleavage/methylation domain-containing protein
MHMPSSTHTQIHGFTLVETLVAIAVLLIVIIGPISAAQKGIQQAYYANEQLSAVFLAQEAIEAVRQLRDDRALEAWDNLSANIDTSDWSLSGCTGTGPFACAVTKDGITYERDITVGSGADFRLVTVTMRWQNPSLFGGDEREVKLQTYLYDHYRRFGR